LNILFEAGASSKIAGLPKGYKAAHVLFVTDNGLRAGGLTRNAEAAIANILFVSSIGRIGTNLESYCEAAERSTPSTLRFNRIGPNT
jgi:alcohol dehydrogenase class IV